MATLNRAQTTVYAATEPAAGGPAAAGPGGEVVGLDQAIAYATGLAEFAGVHSPAGNAGYLGRLHTARVTGDGLATGRDMQDAFATAAAAAATHAAELTRQKTLQQAYDQAPDAGDKDFQTGTADGAAAARPPAAGQAAADRQAEDAVLDAWSRLRVADTSAEAMRIRGQAEEIRRRRRPAPADNPYTGKVTVEELGPDPEQPLSEVAQSWRWTAELFDDNARNGDRQAADDALFWHAAADAAEAAAAAEPPASRPPQPGVNDEAAWQRWLADEQVLAEAGELYDDESTAEARKLRADADAIIARRQRAHRAAIAAGVTPCPANRSQMTPCVDPDGDGHPGHCFAADGGSWPRHTSWWAPETWPAETTAQPR